MTNIVFQMKSDVENPELGIEGKQRIATQLVGCLADSYLLMVKTQGYHWNVVGPLFTSIHDLTERHYRNLFEAVDDLAERIRALGYPAPTSITDMISHTVLQEDSGNPTTELMLENLIRDHEAMARRFRDGIELAEEAKDTVTADMLTERNAFHEKASWMLRALLAR